MTSGTCGENLTWMLDDDGTLTISGEGATENYSGGRSRSKETSPPWYDSRKYVKKIIVNDAVTTIGNYAFSDCNNLTDVRLSNSLAKIGESAFYYCWHLTGVNIPESVKTIGACAFGGCFSFSWVKIPESVIDIGAWAFNACEGLQSVTIPASVTKIGEWIFAACFLKEIHYPEGRSFEKNLSQGNNAKLIPYDAETSAIEAGTSGTCGKNLIWTLDDDGTLTISGTGEMENYVYGSDNDSINSPWWDYREAIKRIIIYDGVTSIGNWAFDGCKSLKNLEMPSSIMTIGKAAFDGCDSLNSLKIPGNVTTIRRGSFSLCMNLKSIKIPDSVTTIGSFAFSLCMNLKDVKISSNVTTIGEETFSWCSSLTSIEIPTSVMTIGKNVFNECINLEKIYYPSGRGFEENLSQGNNAKLIPYDVASSAIEAGTRGICGKNLIWTLDNDGTLTISGTGEMKSYPQVQNLPWFNYRERIKNVVIDFGVTSVSERVFWNCKSLSKITISDSVISIGERAFWSCNSLTEVNIPESVASIGDAPFKGCVYLQKIYYPAGRGFEKILSAGNTAELVPY